jgi:hypothetical protein
MGWYERLRYRRFRLLYAVTRWRGFSSYLRHSCHGSSKINLHGTGERESGLGPGPLNNP